jgi:hypothetical protein
MTQTEHVAAKAASLEEVQQGWHDLTLRVGQLEAERDTLEQENKALRFLLERVIEHRQKSHGELVLLLTSLVSKLPINDVGIVVSRLVEHNTHVGEICAALIKGKVDAALPQPTVLKVLDQTKRDLAAAVKPLVEELMQREAPLEKDALQALITDPESFFSPRVTRANRCFLKGQMPRDRIVKEFSEAALAFFNDMTTDRKLNPNPKPEEIALAFRSDFEAVFAQQSALPSGKGDELLALYHRVQKSKAPTDQARAQKNAFLKLSFILELLHFYENQNTEAPDVIFAQRLPALVEQLVIVNPQDNLDEKLIAQAEDLLAHIISPDHRHMVVNNVGKGGGIARTLKYVFKLRAEKVPDQTEAVAEFVKHLIPPQSPPSPVSLATVLRLIKPEMQRLMAFAIMDFEKLNKDTAEALGKAVGKELGLTGLNVPRKAAETVSAEVERQRAWDNIKELVTRRNDPTVVAAAIRDRLHAKYDAEEIRQSWITLIEVEPISLIRIFCQIPYLPDGSTDPIAHTVMETYVSRLTHEKYANTYSRIVTSLRNMFRANANSPTLHSFLSLVKWVDAEAANKLVADVGMQAPAH